MATKKSARKSSKKSATKSSKKRGSAKLAGSKQGGGFNPASISRLLTTFKRNSLNPNILIDGTPFPDIIRGSFTAKSAAGLNTGLRALFAIRDARYRPLRLFPIGIPFPDEFRVDFDARFRG